MKLLILYSQKPRKQRVATLNHLESFGKHHDQSYYWNCIYGAPRIVNKYHFDIIVLHFTFFLSNINSPFDENFIKSYSFLNQSEAIKVAFIQDEYIHTDSLCRFTNAVGINAIFSCLPE